MNPMHRTISRILCAVLLVAVVTPRAHAACMNKFVLRADGNKKQVTLLTGMMTFPEAQELAQKISQKQQAPIDWVDKGGKSLATAAEFAVVRPMPVSCGDKASGVVVNATFVTYATPSKTMHVKFTDDLTVEFEEQSK